MMEAEFNDNQRSHKITRRARPYGMSEWEWRASKEDNKNRFAVSAKLTQINWHALINWEKKENLNHNSGLNRLIATHPELQNDV